MENVVTRSVAELQLELARGDIARQDDVEAVVNAANAELRSGGGVAGALHRAAGPALAEAGRPLAPLRPGQAVVTDAFDLPNRVVIHVLGPVYGVDEPSDALLAQGYREALARAEEQGIASVAFPLISTGAFGYPLDAGASLAVDTVAARAPTLRSVRTVRFVAFDAAAHDALARALDELDS